MIGKPLRRSRPSLDPPIGTHTLSVPHTSRHSKPTPAVPLRLPESLLSTTAPLSSMETRP